MDGALNGAPGGVPGGGLDAAAGALDELDAVTVRNWCRMAAEALGATRRTIDALNVFPVPDGDTGTNLHLTVLAAAEALDGLPHDADGAKVWRTLAGAALLGARGNSGVILSQLLRGLSDVLATTRCDGGALRRGLVRADHLARAAVARPVEGTILTVSTAAARAAEAARGGLAAVVAAAAAGARAALARTPAQLDVLAESGVVDAGGAGLCVILDVLAALVTRQFPEHYDVPAPTGRVEHRPPAPPASNEYEVMYLIRVGDAGATGLRDTLDRLGDSVVVVGGDGLWNVHVHTDDAGAAVEAGIAVGVPYRIRVTYLAAPARTGTVAGRRVLAVASGPGLVRLFEEAGALVLRREPGAAPTLTSLVEAIEGAGAGEVVLLPNEPRVIRVAEAAAARARESGVRVSVIPTRATVQGLAALAVHDTMRRFDDDVVAMTSAAGMTRTGRISVAAEEAVTSAGICRPGDLLGLVEGDVAVIGDDQYRVAVKVVDRLLAGGVGELVTLIPGVQAGADLADRLREYVHDRRPDVETVVYDGGQVGHPMLIGVE